MVEQSWPTTVAAVAAFGTEPVPETDREPRIAPEQAPRFLEELLLQRLSGLAVAALQADALHLPKSDAQELHRLHRDVMMWALAVERTLLKTAEAFTDAAIDFIVLKGPVVAHTVYPDPSWRPFGDLDLLVRAADWKDACQILSGLGFKRKLPEPSPGFDERFGKAASHRNPSGIEVDLDRKSIV